MNEAQLLNLIRNRSQVYDLETGGFDQTVSPLLEGGIQDLRTQNLERTVFSAHHRHPVEMTWRHLKDQEFTDRLEPWPRRMWETGDWKGFKNESKAHPGVWLRQNWVEPLSQGKWLWAHNARFDLKFVAANLEDQDYQRAASALGSELSYGTRSLNRFHVTAGSDTYSWTKAARENPDIAAKNFVRSYGTFLSHMEKAGANPKQGLVLDSQYLMQVALAHAQEKGLITKTNDVFTGTSVEAWRHAFPDSAQQVSGTAHTVAADIGGTSRLIEDYLTLTGDIRTKQPKDLSPTQKKALLFHQELQTHHTPLFQEKARSSFLKARYDLKRSGKYELKYEGNQQIHSQDFKDILGVYEDVQKSRGYNLDLAGIHKSIASMSHEEVEEAMAQGSSVGEELMLKARASAEALFQAGKFKESAFDLELPGMIKRGATKAWNWSRNKPGLMIVAGLGAVMAGMAVIPGKDDHYNTIEGLKHGWFGQQRRDHTDFGSGYQDNDYSSEVIKEGFDLSQSAYDLSQATKKSIHQHWGKWILGGALTAAAASFIVNPGATSKFFKELPGNIWTDIKKNRVVFGLGAGVGFYQEEQRKETLTPAKWASLELAGMTDDVVMAVISTSSGKFKFAKNLESSPYYGKVKSGIQAVGAAGVGYSVGRAAAAGLKMARRYLADRRKENQKTTGLVQHLDRQKIHHQRMNGY